MKNYTITVNGNTYQVQVEEGSSSSGAPVSRTPVSAPKEVQTPAPKAAMTQGAQGSVKVVAPMPGKILGVKVNAGASVTKGQVMIVLEAMKMENEIVAPETGTVAGINVSVGDSVEAGAVLATLN